MRGTDHRRRHTWIEKLPHLTVTTRSVSFSFHVTRHHYVFGICHVIQVWKPTS